MDNQHNDTLIIKDLNVAAYLLASGEVVLVKPERKNRNLVLFHFSPKDKAQLLVNNYWSDTDQLSPRNVFSAMRSLKDLIFSGT
jgi:hypothetical protein